MAKKATTKKPKAEKQQKAQNGETSSIVNPKYRELYKTREPDFVAQVLNDQAVDTKTVKGKDGAEEERRGMVNVDALFALAEANGLEVEKFRSQVGSPNFAGRFRMTVGNMLRATARKRHGLYIYDNKGKKVWEDAPEEFLAAHNITGEPTHDREGVKVPKAKAEKAEDSEAKGAARRKKAA